MEPVNLGYSLAVARGDKRSSRPSTTAAAPFLRLTRRITHQGKNSPKSVFVVDDDKFSAFTGNAIVSKNTVTRSGRKTYRGDDDSDNEQDDPEQVIGVPRRKRTKKTDHKLLSKDEKALLSESAEFLVPVRVELDFDQYKLRDSFLWNIQDPVCSPEQFASIFCEDLNLPPAQFITAISSSIVTQLDGQQNLVAVARSIEETEHSPNVLIELDLLIGNIRLEDRFEWDLGKTDLTPEDFARLLAADLGVGGEFVAEIAHAIHEQLMVHRRKMLGDWTAAQPVYQAIRDASEADDWSPRVTVLTEQELDKLSEDRERAVR